MNKSPRYHIIIRIFTCPYCEDSCAKLWPRDGRQISTFFLLLFDSIGGAVELAREIKYTRKTEKSAFREIFVARYIPILQYINIYIYIYTNFQVTLMMVDDSSVRNDSWCNTMRLQ